MTKHPLLDSIHAPGDIKALSFKELDQLSEEIREFIIEHVSQTGGHLASNLGVVELTLALHYVFHSPFDQLIWDVGHQSYIHKILTQRKEKFTTLRKYRGLSGFPKRIESPHDVFETGHSSTSISAALGMARGRDLKGEHHHIVAVIGDGALSGGMAFEALNDVGHSGTNLMVVLNDNEMSISRNVGALSTHLSNIRSNPKYKWVKKEVELMLRKVPVMGNPLKKGIERFKNSLKYLLVQGVIFEEMGFTYVGPIDGHSLPQMIPVIKKAAQVKGPVLIHVITRKGKGYPFAEKYPENFHGVPPFNVETGEFAAKSGISYSQAFGRRLTEMAKEDSRVVAITAAMPEGTGLSDFRQQFPTRFFDVGIAEQHAVTMAAGMASAGLRPYVAVYSTFLQRAYDQILHDVCIQNLPVVLAIDRAGLVGEDGETHQGVFDLSYLSHLPNITVWAPKDTRELSRMLETSLTMEGPVAIRYPKGTSGAFSTLNEKPFKEMEWEILQEGRDCSILAVGRMVEIAVKTALLLKKEGIQCQVVNARVIKPLDEKLLMELSERITHWFTLEDNVLRGGFGSFVNEFVMEKKLEVSVTNMGIPDRFISHGSIGQLFAEIDLNPEGVSSRIKNTLESCRRKAYVNL